MKKIRNVLEDEGIREFLEARGILKQYKKGAQYIISNTPSKGLNFKERQPTGSNVWSFRINGQFRAIGYVDEKNELIIVKIDNHQNKNQK